MFNVVLFALKFVFVGLLYVFIFLLIRSVLRDTKLASVNTELSQSTAVLVMNFGKQGSQDFSLTDKVVLGRGEKADIRLDDSFSSTNHAKIYKQGSVYLIQDLKSTNGTLLNGAKVKKETLNNGDLITIGKTTFKFLQ